MYFDRCSPHNDRYPLPLLLMQLWLLLLLCLLWLLWLLWLVLLVLLLWLLLMTMLLFMQLPLERNHESHCTIQQRRERRNGFLLRIPPQSRHCAR